MSASNRCQYPPPSGPYKISPKNAAPWRDHSLARLQISVGKPNTEGDKFFALTEWAAARFERVQLVVSDSLQRWNMAYEYGMGMATAWRESSRAGDHWLARNAEAIAQLPSPEIIRWNYCILDSRFDPALERLEQLAEVDLAFQMALRSTTEAFWQRNVGWAGKGGPERYSAFLEASTAFLLEELAVFTFLCRPAGIDVYAGSWLTSIFEALRQQDGPFFEAFRQDWLQVDFTRNKGFSKDTMKAA